MFLVSICRLGILVSCLLNTFAIAGENFDVFQDAREVAVSVAILSERATRKNAKGPPARRVAMKMARRLRCSSVTPWRRAILIATNVKVFRRQDTKTHPWN